MIESMFVNLNPILQQMFLKLFDMENGEKKDFVLETLLKEFGDVAREARKVFIHYKMLDCHINVISALESVEEDRVKYYGNVDYEGEVKVPTPFKLIGMQEDLEKNLIGLCPKSF